MNTVTVISPETRLFRVKIHHVYAVDLKTTAQQRHLWFEGNFDNFRTFTSPVQDDGTNTSNPRWSKFDVLFVYETAMHHLLLAKLMNFTLYCAEDGSDGRDSKHFLGEASCDLLHLALGPPSVMLTVKCGDIYIGDLVLTVEMEEVAETRAIMRSFEIALDDGVSVDLQDTRLVVETKTKEVYDRDLGKPEMRGGRRAAWNECGTHYFGTTAVEIMQEAGFRFRLVKGGVVERVVARGMVLFGAHMTPEMHLAQQDLALGNKKGAVEQEIYFDRIPMTNDDGSSQVGYISGLVYLQNMPYFIQMYAGMNIDGMIYDGRRMADYFPLPPNIATEEDERARQLENL
jgi:hypothetical protein